MGPAMNACRTVRDPVDTKSSVSNVRGDQGTTVYTNELTMMQNDAHTLAITHAFMHNLHTLT